MEALTESGARAATETGVARADEGISCKCTCERDRHLFCPGPKRMLALDGGGVRGAITVAFLEQIEAVLSDHLKKPIHLGNWFDLIGGTSTGAIIAGALAMGYTTADIKRFYFELAPKIFKRPFFRIMGLQAKYDARALRRQIAEIVGDRTLGSEDLITGFCLVSKRIDTGSPWVLANNPRGRYWEAKPGDKGDNGRVGNKDYPLCNLVRASTAAPFYFDPEEILIARGEKPGTFMDGGVTPHNNPSLRMFLMAVLDAHRLCWKAGPDNLTIVSIGTGSHRDHIVPDELGMWRTARLAYRTVVGLMNDMKEFVLLQMQYLGECLAPWTIDREIGTLCGEAPPGGKMFRFLRYDVKLELPWIEENLGEEVEKEFGYRLTKLDVLRMRSLDDPSIIDDIYRLALIAAKKQVKLEHWTGELATWCNGRQPCAPPRYLPPPAQDDAVGRIRARCGKAIGRRLSYLRSRIVRRLNPTVTRDRSAPLFTCTAPADLEQRV
jgi:hypothetical protein